MHILSTYELYIITRGIRDALIKMYMLRKTERNRMIHYPCPMANTCIYDLFCVTIAHRFHLFDIASQFMEQPQKIQCVVFFLLRTQYLMHIAHTTTVQIIIHAPENPFKHFGAAAVS